MSHKTEGKVITKGGVIQVSDKFKKVEFVIEKTESAGGSTWVIPIKFQLTQDKCDILNNINLGDDVEVSFNIKGNKWEKEGETKYFTNLEAWKIDVLEKANHSSTPQAQETDKLPF